SFLQDARMEVGFTLGVDVVRTHLAIEAEAPKQSQNERFLLPIPLPGLNADFVLIPDLWLRQRLQFMYLPISNFEGLVIDLRLALEWSFVKNVSLGVGLDLMRINLEKQSTSETLGDFKGQFKFGSAGGLLYFNFHF